MDLAQIVLGRIVGRDLLQLWMYARAVITLRIIFKHQLPIRAHVVFDSFRRSQDRHVPIRKFAAQRREPLLQPLRASLQVHENEAFPKPEIHRRQGVVRLVESGDIIHMRRAHQSAVQCVSPRMIRALNRRGMTTRFLLQPASTVSADIVKGSDLTLLISDYDQALFGDRCYEEVARTGKLTLMADQ